MDNALIAIALLTGVLITSGCIDALEDPETDEFDQPDVPEEDPEPMPEDDELEEAPEEDEQENEDDAETEGTSEDAGDSEEEVQTVEISGFADNTYSMDEVNVEEGQTVEFIYTHEAGQHDLALENSEGEEVASTDVLTEEGESDSFTYTFDDEDDYEFYCSVGSHRAQGMEGQITFT